MAKKRRVEISAELYEAIEGKLKEYGFSTVDEYVEFVLQELLYEEDETPAFGEDEEEKIRKRLRDLGYIDG
ncbi:TPA: CopG family transcriptional regulator [Candidatus Poribacteria bacterium]|nr:CopG family transcriptional regulator [Candidatus Poribacteria bacterium]